MSVVLRLTDERDAGVIKNLWPLYVHDLSEFDGRTPNRHGLLLEDESITTLTEHGETQKTWWTKPEALFPYLVLVDGVPAGFNLIAARSYLPDGIDADFTVHEFFVLHPYRGRGVAERAAVLGFEAHPGRWEVVTHTTHARAIAFWRRVIGAYTADAYSECEIDHPWGRRVAFRFDGS